MNHQFTILYKELVENINIENDMLYIKAYDLTLPIAQEKIGIH